MKKISIFNQYLTFINSVFEYIRKKNYPWIVPFAIGVIVRSAFVLSTDFPINDGGMFFTMVQDIKKAGYALPVFTSYNHANIPFAYPPLSFYLAALLSDILPVSLINLFRFLPLTFSILTILVFFKLTEKLVSREIAFYSTFAFVLLPRSFEWQIMGGGLARSLGFLFSLLTLYQSLKIFKKPRLGQILLGSLFLSATILSHFEWAAFALYGLIITFFLCKATKKNFLNLVKLMFIAVLITLPWLVVVIERHGLRPFFYFTNYGLNPIKLSNLSKLAESHQLDFTFLAILAGTGLLLSLSAPKKNFWIPIWFLIPIIITPRSSFNLTTVPVSILIGLSITKVFLPFTKHLLSKEKTKANINIRSKIFKGSLVLMLIYGFMSTAGIYYQYEWYTENYLSKDHRSAMEWVFKNTISTDKFLLITYYPDWAVDAISEWFPALSGRVSIATPQGTEWLPGDVFYKKVKLYNNLKDCSDGNLACFERVIGVSGLTYTYIFLEGATNNIIDTFSSIRQELSGPSSYSELYNKSGIVIYKKVK